MGGDRLNVDLCFAQADVVHFVENQRSSGDDIHVNLTWHSATEVEDVIVSWDEESEAEVRQHQSRSATNAWAHTFVYIGSLNMTCLRVGQGIDTYHIDSGFYKPRQGARL